MHIGQFGTYRTPERHHTKTAVGKVKVTEKDEKTGKEVEVERDVLVDGSVHHRTQTEFAAIVGGITSAHKDHEGKEHPAKLEIALLVPGRQNLTWVELVDDGEDHGEFDPD